MMELSFSDTNPHLMGWAVGLPLSYIALCTAFRMLDLWPKKLPKGTRGSDYMSFDIVAGSALTFFGVVGTIAWLDIEQLGTGWSYRVLEDDKFYGNADFVQNYLIIPIMMYQFWNTVLCFILSDIRDPIMIVHHILTGMLAFSATHPFACYYALFFFGLAESTQLPLTVLDIFDHFPSIRKSYETIYTLSKYLFGAMFLGIRIILWSIVSFEFWTNCLNLLQQPHVHDKGVVLFMLIANIILTGMQYFWAFKILKIAVVGDVIEKKSE